MKVLIVDDEPLAREGLRLMLATQPDVLVVGECGNGEEAVTAIGALQPELVFLDINMPLLDGIAVVEQVGPAHMPLVCFLTAYDEYAVTAFKLNALDYLLKPVTDQRLLESLQRARGELQNRQQLNQQAQLTRLLEQLSVQGKTAAAQERLMIRSAGHVYFLKPADISWVQAEGDYVTIHATGKSHLVRETMKEMEDKLKAHGFQRVHRSSLVNLNAIRELVADHNGDYQVVLRDDTRMKLSRAYREELCEKLMGTAQQELR